MNPSLGTRGIEGPSGLRWRYIRALSSESRRVSSPLPNPDHGAAGDVGGAAAEDHRLIRDFLARRDGADGAIAARLAIIPRILAALSRRLGFPMQQHDLEDTAQDAMAIALRKLGQLPPQVPLDAWLHRLCNFELSNALRRLRRRRSDPLPTNPSYEGNAALQRLERRELLFAALDQLRPADATIVRMHQLEGRTLAEVAVQLQLTENTVKGRYYRSVERLIEIMRNHRPGKEES